MMRTGLALDRVGPAGYINIVLYGHRGVCANEKGPLMNEGDHFDTYIKIHSPYSAFLWSSQAGKGDHPW